MRWRRAHGADLSPAFEVKTLAPHRNQRAAAADPDVASKFDRPRQERAGISLANELKHLRHIISTKHDRIRIVDPVDVLLYHLHPLELANQLPLIGRVTLQALDGDN